MNTIGRIIMLVIEGVFIGFGIPELINGINTLQAIDWAKVVTDETVRNGAVQAIIDISLTGVKLLAVIPALYSAITGRGGFVLFIAGLIAAGVVVYKFIAAYNRGELVPDFGVIWNLVLSVIWQILYFIGAFFILLGRKKGNK